ncbi:hypothetical protein AJ87_22445 [Rhizobium yanglingense]|nr:hypothetical protein AJ87_22445 [Rhizobium yanglingense]
MRIEDDGAVHQQLAILDQHLDAAAGKFLAELSRQPGVEAAFGILIGSQDFPNAGCLFKGSLKTLLLRSIS